MMNDEQEKKSPVIHPSSFIPHPFENPEPRTPSRRLVFLTQYFYPENAAVAQFMTEIAVEMRARGLDVEVLTGRAAYQRAIDLPKFEMFEGIPIRRFGLTGIDKRIFAGRLLNLATFLLSVTLHLVFSRRKPDLLVVSNAPLLGGVGLAARLFRGIPYQCIIEDVYPDLAVKLGVLSKGGFPERVWDWINRRVYTRARSLIVLGKRMESVVRAKLPDRARIHVVYSWADGEAIRPIRKADNPFAVEHGFLDKLIVLYSGNLGLAHDLETLIETADRLRGDERFLFVFIGDGGKKPKLVASVAEKNLSNVVFLPYQPVSNLPYSLTSGDVSVVTMEPGIDGLVIPSKLYGALAAGQAILGLVGDATEVADIVTENRCGVRIAPKDANAAVQTLLEFASRPRLLEEYKKNARACFERHYCKQIAINAYYDVFRSGMNCSGFGVQGSGFEAR